MTAVEWLVEQIKNDQNQKALSASEWMQVIEEAKQMEKAQIEKAFDIGYDNGHVDSGKEPEQYYNENYQNEKKD